MGSVNRVFLIGHLGGDPECRRTQSGLVIAKMRLATSESKRGPDNARVENTQWHSLVAFGQTAEQCEQYLHKGRQIAIEGRLNTRSWDDKGQRRHITEVIVDRVTFLGRRDDAGATDDRDDPEHDGDRGDNGRPPPSGPHAGPPPQVTDDLPF